MVGTFALLAVANMPNLLTYPNSAGFCVTPPDVSIARNVLTILFRVYIPFVVMFVMDVIVFKRLRQSRRRIGVSQMGQRKQSNQISIKEYNFIVSTLLMDLSFVVFYTPTAVHLAISLSTLFITYDSVTTAAVNLLYSCGILTAFLYSVLTFFLFFIFNRYFRNEVLTVLRINRLFPEMSQTVMESGSTNNMKKTLA
jgi:hypothetical protein